MWNPAYCRVRIWLRLNNVNLPDNRKLRQLPPIRGCGRGFRRQGWLPTGNDEAAD